MLINTIFTLLWAVTVVAAFPFFSLSKWQISRRSVQAVTEPQVAEAAPSAAPAQGGFCGSVPVEKPVTETPTQIDEKTENDSQKESAAPSQTLAPSVHWSWDTSALKNVEPIPAKQDSRMYYGASGTVIRANNYFDRLISDLAADPTKEGYFAFLTYRFTLPSINLDHTDHVSVEYTQNDNLQIKFSTRDSFERATGSWETDNELLLIATAKGCAGPSAEDRCYFRATGVEVDREKWTFIASGKTEHPENVMESAETEWGLWAPEKTGRGNSTRPGGNPFNHTANGLVK